MPYSSEHKAETRARIIESARAMFNRRGFDAVSIDEVMAHAGLTRGGFYNHFKNKEELFSETVGNYSHCEAIARWDGVAFDIDADAKTMAAQMTNAYLSRQHFEDVDSHCPIAALPSDASRAGATVRSAYQSAFEGVISVFEAAQEGRSDRRETALAMAILCAGGLVFARAMPAGALADEIREAARAVALRLGDLRDAAALSSRNGEAKRSRIRDPAQ